MLSSKWRSSCCGGVEVAAVPVELENDAAEDVELVAVELKPPKNVPKNVLYR